MILIFSANWTHLTLFCVFISSKRVVITRGINLISCTKCRVCDYIPASSPVKTSDNISKYCTPVQGCIRRQSAGSKHLQSGLVIGALRMCSPLARFHMHVEHIAKTCRHAESPPGASRWELTAHLSGMEGNWNKSEICFGFMLCSCVGRWWRRGFNGLRWEA